MSRGLALSSLVNMLIAIVAILVNGIIVKNIVIDTTYRMIPSIKENNKITLIFLLMFYLLYCVEFVAFICICFRLLKLV